MSESARLELAEAQLLLDSWLDMEGQYNMRRNQLMAKGMSLQQAGIIPLQTDPEWVEMSIQNTDRESLRLKGTDEG